MSKNCGQCVYSHLMVCEGECENKGKNTLLVFGDTDGCFEERVFSEDYRLNAYEKGQCYKDLFDERHETREYYFQILFYS